MAILNGAELRTGTALTAETGSITGLTAGNVVITGDLEVQGTQTIIDSTNVNIGDNIISVNATEATTGGLYVNHTAIGGTSGVLGSGSFIFDGSSFSLGYNPNGAATQTLASFGDQYAGSTIGSDLTVNGNITGSDVQISGFSSVSASLAAISSSAEATPTLDAVLTEGNTSTQNMEVGGLTSEGVVNVGRSTYMSPTNLNVYGEATLGLDSNSEHNVYGQFNVGEEAANPGTIVLDGVSGDIIGSDVQIDGFSSVSASLAAISASAAAPSDLASVTAAGATTTDAITVGGLEVSSGAVTIGASKAEVDTTIYGDLTVEGGNHSMAGTLNVSSLNVSSGTFDVTGGAGLTTVTIGDDTQSWVGQLDVNGDISIDGFSSVSASLAAANSAATTQTLDDVASNGSTTTESITVGGLSAGPDSNTLVTLNGGSVSADGTIFSAMGISTGFAGASTSISNGNITTDGGLTANTLTVGGVDTLTFNETNGLNVGTNVNFDWDLSVGGKTTFGDAGGSPALTVEIENGNINAFGSITGSDVQIDGFSSVSASLAAISASASAPSDLASVTAAGATTTDAITVGGLEVSSGAVTIGASKAEVNTTVYGDATFNSGTFDVIGSGYFNNLTVGEAGPPATGDLTVYGTATVGQLVETSARRFKDNIVEQESQAAKIAALKPVSYNWKDSSKTDFGFIAEEVAEVYPEFVEYNEEGETTGVKYGKMVSVLVKAVQELQAEVAELKAKQ